MKWLIFLSVCFFGMSLYAQSWEDSLRKGKRLYQEGKYDQSYNTLLEAQRMAPANVDLSKDVGNAAYRSGDYKTAQNAFKAAASKEHSPEMRSKKWHNVGNSQMKEKDYAGAVESYKNALRTDPSNEKARYNLAEAKRRLKQQQEKQQQNKNQNDEQQDQESSNQDQEKKDSEKKDGKPEDKDSPKDDSKPSDGQSSQQQEETSEKLSNKKSDRMLEELMKQEMETKKKVRGVNSKESKGEVESGKRW